MSKANKIDIQTLSWNQHIRHRPGMYVSNVDNPTVILREVIDNGIDEVLGGYASKLGFKQVGDFLMVYDNGRGMPINLKNDPTNPKVKITSAEIATSRMNSGSKYEKNEVATGMNGVGTKASNALSSTYVLCSKVTKDNYKTSIKKVEEAYNKNKDVYYLIEFKEGNKVKEDVLSLEDIFKKYKLKVKLEFKPSTLVFFKPDYTLIQSPNYELPITNLALVKLIVKETTKKEVEYFIEGKEVEYELFKYPLNMAIGKTRLLTTLDFDTDLTKGVSKGSVNSLVVNRGLHIREMENALKEGLRVTYNLDDVYVQFVLKGLNLSIILLANEVGFSSQTKENLTQIDGWDKSCREGLIEEVTKFLKKNKAEFEEHIERVKEFTASMNKLKNMDFIKSKVILSSDIRKSKGGKEISKLRDCSTSNRAEAELYIVEGDSAAGSITSARDSKVHGVYPLRGKVLNCQNKSLEQVLENKEIRDLINAIGAGIKGYELKEKPRFGKIIVATDADDDGYSIQALVLGVFGEYMPHLIEKGYVYCLVPPLYKQEGKYYYDGEEKGLNRNKKFTRYKGLGTMNSEDVEETLIKNKRLKQVTLDDLEYAKEILGTTSAKYNLMKEAGIIYG